jgi:hypothetical protein
LTVSKSFGSPEAPTSFAMAITRLWCSPSASLGADADLGMDAGFGVDGDLPAMEAIITETEAEYP